MLLENVNLSRLGERAGTAGDRTCLVVTDLDRFFSYERSRSFTVGLVAFRVSTVISEYLSNSHVLSLRGESVDPLAFAHSEMSHDASSNDDVSGSSSFRRIGRDSFLAIAVSA